MILDDWDPLDRQLVAALQVDGRASFRALGQVLGVSDQTVARRYARLRGDLRIRVLGLTTPGPAGETDWFVRARTTPDAATAIAEALARRDDTAWVSVTSGGTEIVCSTRAPHGDRADTLLEQLPRTRPVVDVSAHALLHVFYGFAESPVLKMGLLDAGQLAALAEGVPRVRPEARVAPDTTDRRLLAVLAEDGRSPVEELVARTGIPATTVRRRLAALREAGTLYFDVDIDHGDTRGRGTVMWLRVPPSGVDRVGRALARHPEVAFAAATTGRTQLLVTLLPTDPASLYRYLTGPVADLPEVLDVETAPVIRRIKGAGSVLVRRVR